MPRNLIVGRTGSRASVIERYLSADEALSLTNAVSEVILEEGAQLSHHRLLLRSVNSGVWNWPEPLLPSLDCCCWMNRLLE